MLKCYEKDNIQLFLGDYIKVLEKVTPESVDMVADPPYMLSNGGITCQAGNVVSVNKGECDKSKGFDADLELHIINKIIFQKDRTI